MIRNITELAKSILNFSNKALIHSTIIEYIPTIAKSNAKNKIIVGNITNEFDIVNN